MKRKLVLVLIMAALCGLWAVNAGAEFKKIAVNEPFEAFVVIEGLDNPWNLCYGPDNWLWVSERTGKRIVRVNPETGEMKVALVIEDAHAEGGHEGVLGFTLTPGFLQANNSNNFFVVYTYRDADNNNFKKLVRYQYDAASEKLINPVVILDKVPAGSDHQGSRLVYGPDNKLYWSLGELGHNQFASFCLPIEAQRLPTAQEMAAKDYASYVGKVLRVNPDGSIPDDNPVLDGVKSHVYTYGHRNPQGLVFVGNYLYSCEHGPSSDDELNLLVAGGNYGWPHVAGFQDDEAYVYANWSAAPNCKDLKWDANVIADGVPTQKESDWKAPANFQPPLKTFWTVRSGYNFHDGDKYGNLGYTMWPTVGPSSVSYYPENGPIPGWGNSILMTTLKNGVVYRIKLTSEKNNVKGDVAEFFKTPNRYRDICLNADKTGFFVITDSSGSGIGMDGVPTSTMQNPGAVILIKYMP